jgi:VanZ family protein
MAVLVCSCLPASSAPIQALDALPISDKLQHAAAYLALAFLPALHERRRTVIILALALVAMGVALEFCQIVAEGRYFSVNDMAADLCGVLLGVVAGHPARGWIGLVPRQSVPEF